MIRLLLSVFLGFLGFCVTAAYSGREISDAAAGYSRIISLYSAHTENLVYMGAGDRLIGISLSDDYPEEILHKPRFSYRDGPEKLIAARPDLVLVRPMIEHAYPDLLSRLRQAGIKVVSIQPTSVEGIFAYWQALGVLAGQTQAAKDMIFRFKEGVRKIADKIRAIPMKERTRVYFEAIHKKMKTFAPESIAIFALEQAGGINVASDADQVRNTNIAAYGKERILARASEIDVFIAQKGRMNPVSIETILEEPGFRAIKALQDGRVFLIDERLVSRPTMRILDGVSLLCRVLYPDLFDRRVSKAEVEPQG